MEDQLSTIERAFQLADIGRYRGVDEIRQELEREGRTGVQPMLQGLSIRRSFWRDAARTGLSPPELRPLMLHAHRCAGG